MPKSQKSDFPKEKETKQNNPPHASSNDSLLPSATSGRIPQPMKNGPPSDFDLPVKIMKRNVSVDTIFFTVAVNHKVSFPFRVDSG